MNILLIPDKFKGSLSAKEVIYALRKGISKHDQSFTFFESIISDGGDGFLEAILETDSIELIDVPSVDPFRKKIRSTYGYNSTKEIAYIELANTSGLALLPTKKRNVSKTTTYGTGLQIKHAIAKGAKSIYVGLGGSATNDGGIGIASALGFRFLDSNGREIEPIGKNLSLITQIVSPLDKKLKSIQFYAVNDVQNPLYGDNGAAFTYGLQKGGDFETLVMLDKGLQNLNKRVKEDLHKDVSEIPGAGAAGGTAFGLNAFFNAQFISGIDFILNKINITDFILNNQIDLIITGEGKIDSQTLNGKVIKGISDMAKKNKIPLIAVCGINELSKNNKDSLGIDAILEIADNSKSLSFNLENASRLIQESIFNYFNYNYS